MFPLIQNLIPDRVFILTIKYEVIQTLINPTSRQHWVLLHASLKHKEISQSECNCAQICIEDIAIVEILYTYLAFTKFCSSSRRKFFPISFPQFPAPISSFLSHRRVSYIEINLCMYARSQACGRYDGFPESTLNLFIPICISVIGIFL